jgi:hypothetical protein
MFCPNCGTESSIELKFCRSCGFTLHTVARLVAGEQAPDTADATLIETVERFQSQRQKLLRWGFLVLWCGLLVLAIGQAGDWMDHPERDTALIWTLLHNFGNFAPIVFVIGIGLMIYSLFLPKATAPLKPGKRKIMPESKQPLGLQPQPGPETILSVTENTTELLEASKVKASMRDTAPQ